MRSENRETTPLPAPDAVPPYDPHYRLLGWVWPPYRELNDLEPYLSDEGLDLLHHLPDRELRRVAKWWARIKRRVL